MSSKSLLALLLVFQYSCHEYEKVHHDADKRQLSLLNSADKISEIPVPDGFKRIETDSASFTAWLRNIRLKEDRIVYLYNGQKKPNQMAQYAVLDIKTGNKDLQQCADAVMRLRAEYLFSQKRYDEISFTDNEKGSYDFRPPYTLTHLDEYLQRVFTMCGSASLAKQLKPRNIKDIQSGDVIIRGGFPGHAVIVTDMAMDSTGKKIFMIAQSYMPAQSIHVLKNPLDSELSPWYEVNDDDMIITPEYRFRKDEVRTW